MANNSYHDKNKDKDQNDEVNLAYQLLKEAGHSMYFRDLITKVLSIKGGLVRSQAQAMAEVHTQINMDSRFVHAGKGMWGLAEWSPQRAASREPEEAGAAIPDNASALRREKLLAAIQQEYEMPAEAAASYETEASELNEEEDLEDEEEND
ncbi:MAG TPA: DNA-directed RNA polymerase subunit delta [Methylomusa anaerophila]|uniref:RNAP delta factor n=1 Tax=Methylomusa anaerophila TaxID=1930071 RepID=A0A348AJG2_9FIRM|nr:DNA-directed RNA polymerase subunit delta [Methylomusa anaerophila]BBB91210.1 putative DNA-directed RNA polymerase subunit delta [Methylomusa anaerophila]HML89795.1 DNA-directed RNA polymerase subunit delta [Methylomusa anaerophila]